TGRTANQLGTLSHGGYFIAPIGGPAALVAFPKPLQGAPSADKARAYLHASCAGCHRPSCGGWRRTLDLRFGTAVSAVNACNAAPIVDDLGNAQNRIVRPGVPAQSVLSLRMHATDTKRMAPLGRSLVDLAGTSLVDSWIAGLAGCP